MLQFLWRSPAVMSRLCRWSRGRYAEGQRGIAQMDTSPSPVVPCAAPLLVWRDMGGEMDRDQLVPGTGGSVAVEHEWRTGGR